MDKKKILILCTLLAIAFSISCTEKGSNVKEITFWAMGAEGEYVNRLIPDFEKEFPDIKVKVQQVPWTAAQEKLITAYASNNFPDVCQLGNTWLAQFAALKGIEPLEELVASSGEISDSNYFEGIWNTNIIDSKLYGIPWYVDTRLLFYRKDIFKKAGFDNPPRSWNELLEISRKIKALSKEEDRYPIYMPTNEWVPFIVFGLQNGASLLKENNTLGNFSSPEFKEAFEYLIDYHREGLAPLSISAVTNVYQAFAEGYIAMYISGPWNIVEFKKWMKDSLATKWGTAPLPAPDLNTPGTSLAGGSSLVINSKSEKKAEAWKLIEYLSRKDIQVRFYSLLNDLPAVKKAWDDPILREDEYVRAFYEQLLHLSPTPKIPEWEQIVFSKIQQYAEYTARDKMSVEEAMEKLDNDVNRILEKRRWLVGGENE